MTQGYKTGGRQKGARNKNSLVLERRVEAALRAYQKNEAIQQATGEIKKAAKDAAYFAGPPDEFLCHVYMDAAYPIETRVRAATNVLPYLKPKLESTHVLTNPGDNAREINKLELARRVAYLLTSNKQLDSMNDVIDVQTNNDQTNNDQTNSADQTVTNKQDQ